MLNRCEFIGNLGRDPEIRATQAGKKIANLSLAVSERWRDKNTGEQKEKTEWVRVVCFNDKLSEIMEKYLKKGSKVFIEGQMQTRKWTDQNGTDKYTTEIVMSGFNGKLVMLGDKPQQSAPHPSSATEPPQQTGPIDMGADDPMDEIPF